LLYLLLDHHHEHGWHGRQGYVFQQVASAAAIVNATTTTTPAPKKRTKRFLGKKTTTTAKPLLAAGSALPAFLSATILPPFLNENIEAVVDGVDACKPYIFSLKIVSPRNAVMGEIEGEFVLAELSTLLIIVTKSHRIV
jgi:hypothetical protein